MHKIMVAICDPDEEYSRRLGEYLLQTGRLADVVCLSEITGEELREKKDLWLVNGRLLSQWKEYATGEESVLCLTEDEMDAGCQELSQIYKYQSVDRILQGMYQELSRGSRPIQLRGKARGQLFLLYQPWYQGLQMLAGFALACCLTAKGKVLYVNPRGFHGMKMEDRQPETRDISDVLTAIRLGSGNMEQRLLAAIVSTEGPDYIRPVDSPVQVEGVETEDYMKLTEVIWQYLDYDYVVMELPTEQDGIREMFDAAEQVYCFLQKSYGASLLARQLSREEKLTVCWIPEQLEIWYREHPCEDLLTDVNRVKEWILARGEEAEAHGCADGGAD